jgi:hypothetical protein
MTTRSSWPARSGARTAPARTFPVLAPALAALALAAAPARGEPETDVGNWDLVWRYSETEGYQNRFREILGNEPVFPFASRRLTGAEGARIAFFDADGREEDTLPLAPEEHALVSADGSAYLLWAERPDDVDRREFRYFQRGRPEPDWEAVAPGRPVLMAPDGSLFVLASRTPLRDRFQRLSPEGVGLLQVVGAAGEVRGELPLFPIFSRLTADGRRVVFLHDEEVITLGRDGILDWQLPVTVDNLSFRDVVPQLAVGEGIVVVCGTGARGGASDGALHPPRQGTIVALDDEGRVKWNRRQRDEDDLWFQISAAVSSDGGTVVTVHAPPRFYEIQAWDGATGDLLWSQRVRRSSGFRSLSVSPGGRVIVFALGDNHTKITVWNREGTVIWDGSVPFISKDAVLAGRDLLVAEKWVVRLGLEEAGE